jgi:hypothetical protein
MKVSFAFVPPGGGETDYSLDFDLPALPQVGDYIFIAKPGTESPNGFLGSSDFIVRRIHWHLESVDPAAGKCIAIVIECEFAEGAYSSETHKRSVDMYDVRGRGRRILDSTVY